MPLKHGHAEGKSPRHAFSTHGAVGAGGIRIISSLFILLLFLAALYFYPQLPPSFASHWNAQGAADSFMPKLWGAFLVPLLAVFLFLLLELLPAMDPINKGFTDFRAHYEAFIAVLIAFLFYVYMLTVYWNFGLVFNMTQLLAPGLGAVFFASGSLMQNSKRNWFAGIRTPWTISSDSVWDKTHKLGALLFKACGVLTAASIILPGQFLLLALAPVLLSTAFLFAYSYLLYQKENQKKK